jgi:hypothetical protein
MKGLERKIEHYSHDKREYECFWGDGYRHSDGRSIIEYHDLHFFNENRGYSFIDATKISLLQVGEYAEFQESGDHWVRRIK